MTTDHSSFDEQRRQICEEWASIPPLLEEAEGITQHWPECRRVIEKELIPAYVQMSKELRQARRPVSYRKLRVEMVRLRCFVWRIYWHPRFWQKRLELILLWIRAYRRPIIITFVIILVLLSLFYLVPWMIRIIVYFSTKVIPPVP